MNPYEAAELGLHIMHKRPPKEYIRRPMALNHEYIKARREQLKLTQTQAAERAGMLQPNWARLESGERPDPNLSTVEAVAKALRCGVAKLIKSQ